MEQQKNPVGLWFSHHHGLFIVLVVTVACLTLFSKQIKSWVKSSEQPASYATPDMKEAKLGLEPAAKEVKVGETFTADIVLDTGNKPVDGIDVYSLHYDPQLLEVLDDVPGTTGVQIKPGEILPLAGANIVDRTAGLIKFSQLAQTGTTYTGKGTVATVRFKALKVGTVSLQFDFGIGSTKDTNVSFAGKDQLTNVSNSVITIK